jgi:PAS domain S-box-containing protein
VVQLYHILYVDDDPPLLEIGKLFLEKGGQFSVDTQTSASAGFSLLASTNYDAIISDYQMPGMDGIEFLKKIRTSGNTIPFILFTGRGREEVVIHALNEGADYYLQKGGEPFAQFAELSHKVGQAVQQRKAEVSIRDHERREADIINFLPDATFAIDIDGIVIAWNHAIEEMTGVPAAGMLGKGNYEYAIPFYGERRPILIDLIFESEDTIAKKYHKIVQKEGVSLIAETTFTNPKGTQSVLWVKSSPLYDNKGKIVGTIESIRDITERKQAEDALHKSEEKYRLTLDATNDGIWDWNFPTGTVFFSPRWYTMLGYEPGELSGTYAMWLSLLHPEDAGPTDQKIQDHILRKNESYTVEFRIWTKQGDWKWILARGKVVERDAEGNPVFVVGTHTDIDEPKRIETELRAAYEQLTATEGELRRQYRELAENEQKLRQSEARYRNVVEDQTELISRFLPDGTHVFVNEAYCRYFGKSREEIVGHIFMPDIPVEDRKTVKIHFASLTPSNPVESIEHRIMMPDGEVRWQRWNDRAIFDQKGNITEFQSVGRDITHRRQAEESLRKSEERYRFLIENASVAIGVVQKKKFLLLNKKATEVSGYTKKELRELPFSTIVHPDDLEYVTSRHMKSIEGLEIKDPYYFRIITKSGAVRWLDVKSVRIFWNKKPATLNFYIDITEQKIAEDSLRLANRRLNMMTSITRHEVNNQITTLMGFFRILEKKQSDPSFGEYFEKISTTAKRISAMIGFTKEYEKIGVHAPVWQDTRTIVDTATKELLLGNVNVKNDLPAGTEVLADPLIVKVFYTLIDNAVRYGGKLMAIRFTAQESGDDQLIVCEDDGHGVPADEKEKIFDRGFGKNTGFGLCFAREILSSSGITIRETGEPGKGARFEMTMPKGVWRSGVAERKE